MGIATIACPGWTDSREMNGAVRCGSDAETRRGDGKGAQKPPKLSPWRPNPDDIDTAGAGGLGGDRRE